MEHTATYSPEDNKLRLYPACRLDRDLYNRVRSAGFIWAPKQELFVAPMWTPDREDFLLELCDEIGDEDKSLVERAEERSDRFEDYSESRKADAESAHKAVHAITDGIPLGQPILVGHHSEKRARKDAERIDNGMRRAVKMWETSKYWADRARGAIRAAKYKERPDVRARRIKKIEAEKRKSERSKAGAKHCLDLWENCPNLEIARHISGMTEAGWLPVVKHPELDQYLHPSDVLPFPDRDAYKNEKYPTWTLEQVQERARVVYNRSMAASDRWIQHYDNRLAYERAMLEEDGGTAADRVKPEKGGACRCWCSPHGREGFSYIQKVNKVSVSVLRNYGNDGGRNFLTTVPFEDLYQLKSAAEVEKLRAAGRLIAVDEIGFLLLDGDPPAKVAPVLSARPEAPQAAKFEALKETLKAGGVQVVTAPQLFPTPPELAARLVELAELCAGDKVLEPSAGTGNLIKAIMGAGIFASDLTAVEINGNLAKLLQSKVRTIHKDFLECNGELGLFDRVIMNPPFKNGEDIKHIEHATKFLAEGGKVIAICANGPRQQEALRPFAEEWIPLPAGSFSESGTEVNAAIVIIGR